MDLAHGRDLRIGRYSEAGRIYSITAATYAPRPLFRHLRSARLVVETLHHAADQTDTLCYCLMPDHLHWLLRLKTDSTLAAVMQRVKSISAHRTRAPYPEVTPPIWQKGFHDRALRKDEDLPAVARYIVANPLRARIVRRLGDYPYWDAIWL